MPPATAASNSRSTWAASAAANSSVPTLASSSLLAVTTGLPSCSAVVISSRAGSMPPMTSTTRSMLGSVTTAWASRVSTPSGQVDGTLPADVAHGDAGHLGGAARCGRRSSTPERRSAARTRHRRYRSPSTPMRTGRPGSAASEWSVTAAKGRPRNVRAGSGCPDRSWPRSAQAQTASAGRAKPDRSVEAVLVEHAAHAPHAVSIDVEDALELGVARAPLAVPRPGADQHLVRVIVLRRQRDADETSPGDGRTARPGDPCPGWDRPRRAPTSRRPHPDRPRARVRART